MSEETYNVNAQVNVEDTHNESFTDKLYNYFISNLVSSIMFITNIIGLLFFLAYFYHIEYLPNVDFSGVVYLLVVMSLMGVFFSAIIGLLFVLPGWLLKFAKNEDNHFSKYFYGVLAVILLLFPIVLIYSFSKNDHLFEFGAGLVILIASNVATFFTRKEIQVFFIAIYTLFAILMSFKIFHVVPSAVLKSFHMAEFNATVVFKHDFCQTLKNYNVPINDENKISCSAKIKKVLWRVGKESLLMVNHKRFTVPSDQIISMSWSDNQNDKKSIKSNVISQPVISFEFNSTVLTKNGKQELLKQVKALDNNTTKEITIYGCASPEGTEKYNKTLSLERAQSVQSWIDGYLARGNNQIKTKVMAEGTSKHCSDDKLIQNLKEHRKVIIQ